MSGLWTPGGDDLPDRGEDDVLLGGPGAGPGEGEQAAMEEELHRVRAEIAATPAVDIVANHAIGLWQLALLHLNPEPGTPPRLDQAAVAIDAMGGIVDALGDRLGEHGPALRDALTQLRLAFVEVQRRVTEGGDPG